MDLRMKKMEEWEMRDEAGDQFHKSRRRERERVMRDLTFQGDFLTEDSLRYTPPVLLIGKYIPTPASDCLMPAVTRISVMQTNNCSC